MVRQLGRGGMACVYLADDLRLEQPVALKLLFPWRHQRSEQSENLLDEVRFARRVSHANVCRVYDVGESDQQLFLVMEYIEGKTLKELLALGALASEQALAVSIQICRGLAAIHEQGLLHRDLKPANVMIGVDGQVRLTDFGLAVSTVEAASRGARLAGTPAYMAPELLFGKASIGSDLYALGMVLHEIFTGRRAHSKQSLIEFARRWADESGSDPMPLELDLQLADIDPGTTRVIRRCLATKPDDRPASAEEVESALRPETGLRTLDGHSSPEENGERTLRSLLIAGLMPSTALVEKPGDEGTSEVCQRHDRLARDLLCIHNGIEIDKTDSLLLLFERPLDSVLYALAYHNGLQELSAELEVTLVSRIGIHFGELYLRRNPSEHVARGAKPIEVEGLARVIATRLVAIADGGQTLLTRNAFDLARRAAVGVEDAESLVWLAHGGYLFKGIGDSIDVFEVGREGIAPLSAPEDSDEARQLVEQKTIPGWRPAPGLAIPLRTNWHIEERLGGGGFGEAWLARHHKTNERRVFKFCYDPTRLRALQREITLFRLLKEELGEREDINRILDWSFDQVPYYIESEYTEAGNLVDWAIEQGGLDKVPLAVRLEIMAQVATALAAAHSVGVLHKDIKPANILISTSHEGEVQARLCDFGVGAVTDARRLAVAGITALGMSTHDRTMAISDSGTRLYTAPEVLEGKPATLQSDIYALGLVLYQIVVGDFTRALAPGWQRDVAEELLREDIASAVDGSPVQRLGNALRLAEQLRALDSRREQREAERRERREAAQLRATLEGNRRRRRMLAVAVVSLVLFTSTLATMVVRVRQEAGRANREATTAQAVSDFLVELFETTDPYGYSDPGLTRGTSMTVRELLKRNQVKLATAFKDDPLIRAQLLATLGAVYRSLGHYEEAELMLREALEMRRRLLGEEHADIAASLHSLAILSFIKGDYEEAEALCREALEMNRRLLGGEHPCVGNNINTLADILNARGQAAEAEVLIYEALSIFREVLPPDHWWIPNAESLLGSILTALGRYEEAEPLLVACYPIIRGKKGAGSRQARETLARLVALYESWGRLEKAAEYRELLVAAGGAS
jgi:serine/threonine-protein kinase